MQKSDLTFWITNISNRNVTLSDLNISIKANSSINLLDGKHHYYTLDQLNKSLESGSLFVKRDKIVKRLVPPGAKAKNVVSIDNNAIMPTKQRSILEVKIEKFQELDISDEDFAIQSLEMTEEK